MITTILFDVDGVLIDSFEANLKYFQDLFSQFNFERPTREDYLNLFHKPMRDVIKIWTKLSEEETEKIYRFGMGSTIPYDISLASIPNGVEEVLEIFSKNYNLGVVTSRVRESVFEGPRNNLSHIRKYFKVVVSFEDTENHKPHPDPLLFAAGKFDSDPKTCVYIGDTESDMVAARSAEMKFIHYSQNPSREADGGTYNFTDLPRLVGNI